MTRAPRWTPEEYRQRPNDFDPLLADRICERVLNGEVLTEICMDRDLPLPGTFLRWVNQDPTLRLQYEEAQRTQVDVLVDEAVVVSRGTDFQSARVQLDALKWRAERVYGAKYGPRTYNTNAEVKDPTAGGVDYGAEVIRKIELMAQRHAEEMAAKAAEDAAAAAEGRGLAEDGSSR